MIKEMHADVVIIGGSIGGCAAALAASKMGKRVIMTEETEWIGGQITNQAVPPDEHPWIEHFGCTQSYREYRNRVRQYYASHFPLSATARKATYFNPGNALVSQISHDPRVSLAVLQEMMAPYVHSGRLTILSKYTIQRAKVDRDQVLSLTVKHVQNQDTLELVAPFFLDATDCGDVLPLAGVEYVTGAESKKQTGEPHALDGAAQAQDMQAFTYCFAVDYLEGEDHTISKPPMYDFWKGYQADFWPAHQLSWTGVKPHTLEPVEYALFEQENKFSLWQYRRIIDKRNFSPEIFSSDISLVNWPQNDYWLGSVIDVPTEEREKHLYQAKQLSLSLLFWMQTEAPRPDGKVGYPGLRLRKDVVGTQDGLAMYPYIRESRRVQAEFTVLEQHVSTAIRNTGRAETFYDSVGIGSYRIDLHPSTRNRTYIDISSLPFQIPLGSMIPIRVNNLLPACKNIGVTHITNGCYRLHPVEWNIGEVAGYLASYCINHGLIPRGVRSQEDRLLDFQRHLSQHGVELQWPSIGPV